MHNKVEYILEIWGGYNIYPSNYWNPDTSMFEAWFSIASVGC